MTQVVDPATGELCADPGARLQPVVGSLAVCAALGAAMTMSIPAPPPEYGGARRALSAPGAKNRRAKRKEQKLARRRQR